MRIREIIHLDEEIQQLASQARDSVRDELLQIGKAKTAAKAYIASE